MLEVKFYEQVDDGLLKFAVVISKTDGKWVFCKHKERDTYEVPGGHREMGETILETAKRELREETGAIDFQICQVCVYSVKGKTRVNENIDDESFGMLFVTDIFSFEKELHKDIVKEYIGKFEFYHCFETPNMHWLDCRMNDVGQRVCFMAEYFLPDMSKLKCLPWRYWSGKKFHFIAVHGPIFVLPEMQ